MARIFYKLFLSRLREKLNMKRFLISLMSAAIIVLPVATISSPVEAKTSTQVKNEKKGADAKAKTKAKSDASKAKSAAKKKK
jgi:hypothetical protein